MSRYLWLNILAMILLVVVIALGAHITLNIYTHHGESISVPDVRRQSLESAQRSLENRGFIVEVNDTGYVKNLPSGVILEQMPAAGTRMKSGRVVYLTINSANSPTLALPDIIDNSSLREAQARLTAIGFRLTVPKYVPGEKDWVYGIKCRGRLLSTGDKVPIDAMVVLQVGNGTIGDIDDLEIIDKSMMEEDIPEDAPEEDPFEEVTEEQAAGHGTEARP